MQNAMNTSKKISILEKTQRRKTGRERTIVYSQSRVVQDQINIQQIYVHIQKQKHLYFQIYLSMKKTSTQFYILLDTLQFINISKISTLSNIIISVQDYSTNRWNRVRGPRGRRKFRCSFTFCWTPCSLLIFSTLSNIILSLQDYSTDRWNSARGRRG